MEQLLRSRLLDMDVDGKIAQPWSRAFLYLCYCDRPDQEKVDAFDLWESWGKRIVQNDWRISDLGNLLPLIKGRRVVALGMAELAFEDGQKAFKRPAAEGPAIWQIGGRRG